MGDRPQDLAFLPGVQSNCGCDSAAYQLARNSHFAATAAARPSLASQARPRLVIETEPMSEAFSIRLAREDDIPALEILLPLSVRALQADFYSPAQIEAALGPVFGVDRRRHLLLGRRLGQSGGLRRLELAAGCIRG